MDDITKSNSLDKLSPKFGENTTDISPEDKRQNFNTYLSGALAVMLWGALLWVMFWHTTSIGTMSNNLVATQLTFEEAEKKVEHSSILINDTAKSLYAFIGPLATAVTSFYYHSVTVSNSNNNSKDE